MSNDPAADDPWADRLSAEQYYICRQGGTEPPFSGALLDEKRDGVYHCAACDAALFVSGAKYNSGSGWPSFFRPHDPAAVREIEDRSHGMTRTEVRCAGCDSHLGHVFPDGPPPTGLRYCINSLAMTFSAEET